MSMLVFVYGTLRRGGCYHGYLRSARYVGANRSAYRFTMLNLGPYPGVIDRGNSAIFGEIYLIDHNTLLKLDQLEDYPRTYTRRTIRTQYGPAWIYLYQLAVGREPVIRDGNWRMTKNQTSSSRGT